MWTNITIAVCGAVFLIGALVLALRSSKRDEEIAVQQRAAHPEPEPEPAAVVPVIWTPPSPVQSSQPAVIVNITFGQVFWPAVCAQLFLSFIAWLLWLLLR